MKRLNNRRGFTMVELLIVVAIMGVLSAVVVTGVLARQRSLARLERDTIAKEIFVAAQNHLTMAKSQGYLGLTEGDFGTKEDITLTNAVEPGSSIDTDENSDIYYIVKGEGNPGQKMLDLMLPEGSIDGTVRDGGSYIIRYQKDLARVLDVFYCTPYGPQYDCVLQTSDYTGALLSQRSDIQFRQDFGKKFTQTSYRTAVLGWYGGEEARLATISQAETLSEPEIKVVNAEMLYVLVKDPNAVTAGDNHQIQLVVTGVTSGYQTVFTLEADSDNNRVNRLNDALKTVDGKTYNHIVVLDDITTTGLHFADMKDETSTDDASDASPGTNPKPPTSFIPGEDIVVQARVFDDTRLTNIAESLKETTNSLYAGIMTIEKGSSGSKTTTAYINNFRHLENLYQAISSVQIEKLNPGAVLRTAEQTADLDWAQFCGIIPTMKKSASGPIYIYSADETEQTGNNYYHPVDPNYELNYDGMMHSISKVSTVWDTDAGLFGNQIASVGDAGGSGTINPLHVKDVELIDFSITSNSGNAGALVGTLISGSATNVLAHNTPGQAEPKIKAAGNGNAGGLIGLIGEMEVDDSETEEKKIDRCAAALLVESTGGNAGGLIGAAQKVIITDSYSGGHTTHDSEMSRVYYDPESPNVKAASGAAGGFIGKIFGKSTTIDYSYSTCSAEGVNAGGFVGDADAGMVSNCYCTGLVKGSSISTEGAFAGCKTLTATGCQYFEIINERPITGAGSVDLGYECLDPLPKEDSGAASPSTGITALDATVEAYEQFCGAPDTWLVAVPYDSVLATLYQGRYNLRTVNQLKTTVKTGAVAEEGSHESDSLPLGDDGAGETEDKTPTPADYVVAHYGDWPAPEVFTPNTPDGSEPEPTV